MTRLFIFIFVFSWKFKKRILEIFERCFAKNIYRGRHYRQNKSDWRAEANNLKQITYLARTKKKRKKNTTPATIFWWCFCRYSKRTNNPFTEAREETKGLYFPVSLLNRLQKLWTFRVYHYVQSKLIKISLCVSNKSYEYSIVVRIIDPFVFARPSFTFFKATLNFVSIFFVPKSGYWQLIMIERRRIKMLNFYLKIKKKKHWQVFRLLEHWFIVLSLTCYYNMNPSSGQSTASSNGSSRRRHISLVKHIDSPGHDTLQEELSVVFTDRGTSRIPLAGVFTALVEPSAHHWVVDRWPIGLSTFGIWDNWNLDLHEGTR